MDFSKVTEGKSDEGLGSQYHYNHSERLEHAPKIVREYYEGRGPRPTKGLFRVLVGNRGNRFMLASIGLLAAFIWIYSFFINRAGVSINIEGRSTAVTSKAFSYDEKVFTNITIASHKALLTTPQNLVITYYAIDGDGAECLKDTQEAIYNGEELAIKKVFTDFDIRRINCHLEFKAENTTSKKRAQSADSTQLADGDSGNLDNNFVDFTMKVKKE